MFKITTYGARNLTDRPGLSLQGAVSEAIDAAAMNRSEGTFERLRAATEEQNEMIARMLAVMFNEYGDHYYAGCQPATDAEKLGFILGPNIAVREA